MNGTFGGGDLISASLAIMLGGEGESELHDKEVSLSTSDVTGSQTAVFEYDPADEDPQGDPPGPWDGYSLFTIDLSAVKDDIEALQATIAAIIAILQAHDPDYDPDETPPEDGVQDVVDEEEALEDCRDAVIAKIQEYFPSFNPQTCQDLVDKIEEDEDDREDAEEHEGYEFPEGTPIDPILELVGGDRVTDEDADIYIRWGFQTIARDGSGLRPLHLDTLSYTLSSADGPSEQGYIGFRVLFRIYQTDGTLIVESGLPFEYTGIVGDVISITDRTIDYTTGRVTFKGRKNGTVVERGDYDYTVREIIGYGDPSHTKKVKNV